MSVGEAFRSRRVPPRRLKVGAVIGGLGTCLLAATLPPVSAQSGAVSYTEAQATAGETSYAGDCAGCHGADLSGSSFAPPLKGDAFRNQWFGKPLSGLYTFVSTEMPQDRPGGLPAAEYANVVAFLLKSNGVAAGTAELPTDAAAQAGMTLPPV